MLASLIVLLDVHEQALATHHAESPALIAGFIGEQAVRTYNPFAEALQGATQTNLLARGAATTFHDTLEISRSQLDRSLPFPTPTR